jgi:hypothetical protein
MLPRYVKNLFQPMKNVGRASQNHGCFTVSQPLALLNLSPSRHPISDERKAQLMEWLEFLCGDKNDL